jgi:spore coat protein H
MPRSNRTWSYKKIFAVGFILYTAGMVVVLTAAFYWVSSIREKGRRAEEEPLRRGTRRAVPNEDQGQELVRSASTPMEQILEVEQPDSRPSTNKLPTGIVQDSILGSRTSASRSHPGDDLFKNAFIPRLQIEIPAGGMLALRVRERNYVRATIREGDIVYTNVAIRLKGGPGSFRKVSDTPSFTVNFDKFAEGQTFHGLKKIHLNSSVQDDGLLSEKISRELFEAAGVPAPRAGHAAVVFNGRPMRMYVVVEGINKQFLRRYFKDVTGNVYDGHSGSDVTDNEMETNAGDHPNDQKRLKELAAAAKLPAMSRLDSLQKTLDIDRFLSFMAMETILWHWDGYTMHRNNFRIYHDRDTDRMVFIPQGLDQILSKPNGPIIPPLGGLVAKAVFEIPELRQRYEERVAQLVTNVFRMEAINRRIDEVAARISETLVEMEPSSVDSFRRKVSGLSRQFANRSASLQRQIFPATALKLAALDTVSLTDWRPTKDLGEAQLNRKQDEAGNSVLHISTENGCTASWRTHVLLDRGKYRFEARLKTQGVVLDPDDPRAGAGLRISRHRVGQKNSGNRDWMPAAFDLEVREDQSDVELVCELRANQGDVWFDVKSLRITRR